MYQYNIDTMSNSEYSQLLTKMEELKQLSATYSRYTQTYRPAVSTVIASDGSSTFTQNDNKNAISTTTTPLGYRAGEDYGEYWKYVGKVTPNPSSNNINANSLLCWNMAARDPRVFKKVVYTGDAGLSSNPGVASWNNHCYGLTYDAPNAMAEVRTDSVGYSTMEGRTAGIGSDKYTKLGITNAATLNEATQLKSVQDRVNTLVAEIAQISNAGTNSDLNTLIGAAADSATLIEKINQYMNEGTTAISDAYNKGDKRKEMNDVYLEVNEKKTLYSRKYRFIIYIIIAICFILGYALYSSELTIKEQLELLKGFKGFGWWGNWWIIAIVVFVFILSSFGWDMKGNIMMVIRYITDPQFWTGQLWWVGVTFLLLIIIFLHATFKSFFTEIDAGLKSIQGSLDGDGDGGGGEGGGQ
jgi:hypothetical protein